MREGSKPRIVILGAGPAGLGAAYQLTRNQLAHVTVIEKEAVTGGNARSFELAGIKVDYGSHRLHPSSDPEILSDIKELLADDFLVRPRHGRIRLSGRWIHFPLKPLDLALRLPPSFSMGVMGDFAAKVTGRVRRHAGKESFASVLEAGLGRTICKDFYFPYAVKMWGLSPEELSATQARRRVSAGSMQKMFRKVLSSVPGLRTNGSGRFYYPRKGFGQISDSLCQAAQRSGAEFHLGATVKAVRVGDDTRRTVVWEQGGRKSELHADHVWSTIPLTELIGCLEPAPPSKVVESTRHIRYRSMLLIYLVLGQDRFSEYDAHYFPETAIPITRLSETKNYHNVREPRDRTVVCAELPCFTSDTIWSLSDDELGGLLCQWLAEAGIPPTAPVIKVATQRLHQAYPVYQSDYETHLEEIDKYLEGIDGLLSFGRQGLHAHDNTHHALFMAYAAVKCLCDSNFDTLRWQSFRRIFDTHVVED